MIIPKRSLRRHHRARRLKRVRRYFCVKGCHEKHIRIAIDTPKRCSCAMCGNPRKHFHETSLQEQKVELEQNFYLTREEKVV